MNAFFFFFFYGRTVAAPASVTGAQMRWWSVMMENLGGLAAIRASVSRILHCGSRKRRDLPPELAPYFYLLQSRTALRHRQDAAAAYLL